MASDERGDSQSVGEQTALQQRSETWRQMPSRIFAFLLSADFFFIAVFALLVIVGRTHTRVFDVMTLDAETNPPSWYSAIQLFVVAFPFLMLGSKLIPARGRANLPRLWLTLGIGLSFLSLDENVSLHEDLGPVLRRFGFGVSTHGGAAWIVIYLLVALALVVWLRKDLVGAWREWRPEFLVFALGFAILIMGAGVIETVGHVMKLKGTIHYVEVGFEEGLEMIGVSVMALPAYRIFSHSLTGLLDGDAEPDIPAEG